MKINNVIVISDTHIGCQFGLYNPKLKFSLDGGGKYSPSSNQLKVWAMWEDFWNNWVPMVTKKEKFILVHNGDVIDGKHHKSNTQITQNITDQKKIAYEILAPIIDKSAGYYHIRGTDAHVGSSGEDEEDLARMLGAIPDEADNNARHEMWLRLGQRLIHFSHHIGTTSSSAYESTAVYKELVEALTKLSNSPSNFNVLQQKLIAVQQALHKTYTEERSDNKAKLLISTGTPFSFNTKSLGWRSVIACP